MRPRTEDSEWRAVGPQASPPHARLWYRFQEDYRALKNTKPPIGQDVDRANDVNNAKNRTSHERCDRLMSQVASQWDDQKKMMMVRPWHTRRRGAARAERGQEI
jgi:hypothetical protein